MSVLDVCGLSLVFLGTYMHTHLRNVIYFKGAG